MPRKEKSVWVLPGSVTASGNAHVTWAHEGNFNKGRESAKVTAKNGSRSFRTYREAITFGKRQALRMGNGTKLDLHGTRENLRSYIVTNGKFVKV